jgi:mono/diheme cytochrome c family protein
MKLRLLLPFSAVALIASATSHKPPAAAAREGERLAYSLGCVSCHDRDLTGHLVEEDRDRLYAYSTNLSLLLPRWSDADIARALRSGKRPDGSDIWVMPVHSFRLISDPEMAALIAFMRSVPPKGLQHPPAAFGPRAQAAIRSGKAKSPAGFLQEDIAKAPPELGPSHREGRRLALLVCGDCHGPDLKGYVGEGAPPDLTIAAAYELPAFATVVRTGRRPDGTETGMTPYSKDRLFRMSDSEIAAVWRYLRAKASAAPVAH